MKNEICRLQRSSPRAEGLNGEGQNLRSTLEKEKGGPVELPHGNAEKMDNAQPDIRVSSSDGQNAANLKSPPEGHEDHIAESSRETQYRGLYLKAKGDYEKLREAYFKLKDAYEGSKNIIMRWRKDKDIENVEHKGITNGNRATTEDSYHLSVTRTPLSKVLLHRSARSLGEVFKPCSTAMKPTDHLPRPELREEKVLLDTRTRSMDVKRETTVKDSHEVGDPPKKTVEILPLTQDQSLVEHQLAKIRPGFRDIEEVKIPKDMNPSLGDLVKEESEEPILISERSLKRKRRDLDEHTTLGDPKDVNIVKDSFTKSARIKSEHESSSPLSAFACRALANPHDSIDLDEVGDRTHTPRKRRQMWAIVHSMPSDALSPLANTFKGHPMGNRFLHASNEKLDYHNESHLGYKNDTDLPFTQEEYHLSPGTKDREYAEILEEEVLEMDRPPEAIGKPAVPSETPSSTERLFSRRARYWLHNRKTLERSAGTECSNLKPAFNDRVCESMISSRLKGVKPPAGEIFTTILGPIDQNRQMLPRTSDAKINQHPLQNRRERRPAISGADTGAKTVFPAEDGEKLNGSNDENAVEESRTGPGFKPTYTNSLASATSEALGAHQRLAALLSNLPFQSPQPKTDRKYDEIASGFRASRNGQGGRSHDKDLPISGWKPNRFSSVTNHGGESSVEKTKSPNRLAPTSEHHTVPPTHQPLRIRPLNNLCPEDFKFNAQHNNEGLPYAYSEVIRNRDARKCMDGCTRSGCCGTLLRKAIEIGGYMPARKPRLSNNATTREEEEAEEEEDQHLLEEYLGDAKYRLKHMPEAERKEILLKAQTEKFAKQYGKHRHLYTRGSTPPGFWDTDMPTTQQEIENRKAAQAMERQKVEDMYREAMRPNGRYRFRDE